MGITRKLLSISTLGAVRFRNPSERTARHTRQTRNAARAAVAQNAVQIELQRQRLAQAQLHHVDSMTGGAYSGLPTPPPGFVRGSLDAPAGWYVDRNGDTRWFDGESWTAHVHQPLEA